MEDYLQYHASRIVAPDRQYDPNAELLAAIYQKPVCDICLNCPIAKCDHMTEGCEAYRQAVRKAGKETGQRRKERMKRR